MIVQSLMESVCNDDNDSENVSEVYQIYNVHKDTFESKLYNTDGTIAKSINSPAEQSSNSSYFISITITINMYQNWEVSITLTINMYQE